MAEWHSQDNQRMQLLVGPCLKKPITPENVTYTEVNSIEDAAVAVEILRLKYGYDVSVFMKVNIVDENGEIVSRKGVKRLN